jgi:hypothetical protein
VRRVVAAGSHMAGSHRSGPVGQGGCRRRRRIPSSQTHTGLPATLTAGISVFPADGCWRRRCTVLAVGPLCRRCCRAGHPPAASGKAADATSSSPTRLLNTPSMRARLAAPGPWHGRRPGARNWPPGTRRVLGRSACGSADRRVVGARHHNRGANAQQGCMAQNVPPAGLPGPCWQEGGCGGHTRLRTCREVGLELMLRATGSSPLAILLFLNPAPTILVPNQRQPATTAAGRRRNAPTTPTHQMSINAAGLQVHAAASWS